jgi:hypothetical protein
MKRISLILMSILLSSIIFGQKNYFWTEVGLKYPVYKTNVLYSGNSLGQSIQTPFNVVKNRAILLSYGYGRKIFKSLSLETGVTYNRYKFSYDYFSKKGLFVYPDFFAIELPIRLVYSYKIKKINAIINLGFGQAINFIGIKTLPQGFSPAYGLYIKGQDTVYDSNFSALEKDIFRLTQFSFGINKSIGKKFQIGLTSRYSIGSKNIFRSQIGYSINDDRQNNVGANPRYGTILVTTKGDYYNISLTGSYKF